MPLDDLRWWPCSVLRDVMEAADMDMAFEARLGLENTVREDSDDGRGEYEANDWSVVADVAGSLRIEAGAPGGVYGADVSTCRCRCFTNRSSGGKIAQQSQIYSLLSSPLPLMGLGYGASVSSACWGVL
jgi:hypothetical protein